MPACGAVAGCIGRLQKHAARAGESRNWKGSTWKKRISSRERRVPLETIKNFRRKPMRKHAVAMAIVLSTWMLCGSNVEAAKPSKSETEVRTLLAKWKQAFEAKDVDAVMSVYAPGSALLAYDVVPPLEVKGRDAYRRNYEQFFAQYEGPLTVEFRDVNIVTGSDIAFLYALEKMSGTLKGGQKSDLWIRATSGLRKIDGRWMIIHDHISVPVDFETGKGRLDATP